MSKKTHFGYQEVEEEEKVHEVKKVFNSVAQKYDLMNDLMSLGIHRLWKAFTLNTARVNLGDRVLDVAGGTGDLAKGWLKKVGREGEVWLTDINESMLNLGRDRLLNHGLILPVAVCDAENLPFPDQYFNVVSVAFGLRNMTHKEVVLREMYRVLAPGGQLLILEFSKVYPFLKKSYDFYSFHFLPRLGRWVANDEKSYQYLVESIRMHPDQETLKTMLLEAGFDKVDYHNLSGGIVALHKADKI